MAADLPHPSTPAPYASVGVLTGDAVTAHGWRGYRHRDRVDAGDVLAGVLIIGGIAAIASAASNSSRNRDYRDDRYRNDYRYRSSDDRPPPPYSFGHVMPSQPLAPLYVWQRHRQRGQHVRRRDRARRAGGQRRQC